MTVLLPRALAEAIKQAAAAAAPRECCGLIEGNWQGDAARALALYPARNIALAADRFEIAPEDHFAALKAARAHGHALIGCYHSHPGGAARPSPTDKAGAGEEGFLWLIAGAAALEAFIYAGGDFAPISLAISG